MKRRPWLYNHRDAVWAAGFGFVVTAAVILLPVIG